MKTNKRDRVIRYVNRKPDAKPIEVSKALGITYGYAYKVMRGIDTDKIKARIAQDKAEKAKVRAAKEAKTAEFHAKQGQKQGQKQRITRAELLTELMPGLNALFGEANKFKEISDGSTAKYYVLPKSANELQDLISHKNMNAQIGEIFRACYRYGEVAHSKMLRDAKKIKFYAEAEIKRLEKLNESKD